MTGGGLALPASGQATAFTYQGFLTENGAPANGVNDFEFRLFNDPSVGAQQGGTVALDDVGVTNGLFTVTLDFGGTPFNGGALWINVAVRPGASVGAFTNLSPRQPITAAPYAIRAGNAVTVAMGTISDPAFIGTTTAAPLQLQVSNNVGWRLVYPTAAGSLISVPNIVGGFAGNRIANENEASIIAGGGSAAFTNIIEKGSSYSVIGGGAANVISTNAGVSTIAGGADNSIGIGSDYSTIGGGTGNAIGIGSSFATIAGGNNNAISNNNASAAIAGGAFNKIGNSSAQSVIGGGTGNTIGIGSAFGTIGGGIGQSIGSGSGSAFIGGGQNNDISYSNLFVAIVGGGFNTIGNNSEFSVIGGGGAHIISSGSRYSVIPGGYKNTIGTNAINAFAAGRLAMANHPGTFVWGDYNNADFASTTSNQFLIRASGGVGINTNVTANAALTVSGDTRITGLLRSGSESGTAEAPSPAGLVIRRINSTTTTSNTVVAIARNSGDTANITLVRDGTPGGFQIKYPATPGNLTIACMGIDSAGVQRNFYAAIPSGPAGTIQVYSNALNLVHFQCTFGITFLASKDLTRVTLSRYGTDTFWSGDVVSTYNQ